jgi:hypothetical protein
MEKLKFSFDYKAQVLMNEEFCKYRSSPKIIRANPLKQLEELDLQRDKLYPELVHMRV